MIQGRNLAGNLNIYLKVRETPQLLKISIKAIMKIFIYTECFTDLGKLNFLRMV